MKIIAELKIDGNKKELSKLFSTELDNIKSERSSFEINSKKDKFTITIKAKDSTSFRAISNSISKLLTIYEKTDEVINDEN